MSGSTKRAGPVLQLVARITQQDRENHFNRRSHADSQVVSREGDGEAVLVVVLV